jgi:hypothetical protein
MFLFAVETLFAIAQYSEVATHTMTWTNTNVWIRAVRPVAASVVGEVNTKRCSFRCRYVRQVACFGRVRAVALQKLPANRDLVRVMLIWTGKAATATAWKWTKE